MFKFTKKDKRTDLEKEIERVLKEMSELYPSQEDYNEMFKNLERLNKMKTEQKGKDHVSPDTLVVVAGNLAGIILILNYEKFGVVASKALGFVIRGRV